MHEWFLTGGRATPGGASINFQGGASPYASYHMESLINKFSNKYICFYRQGDLKQRTITEPLLYTTQQPQQDQLQHANSIVFATLCSRRDARVDNTRQYRSLIITSASGIVQCFICHWISVFRFDLPRRRKFTHAHVCVNIECNFSAKSFTLKNLSSLTNFQRLSAVSNNVYIVHFY